MKSFYRFSMVTACISLLFLTTLQAHSQSDTSCLYPTVEIHPNSPYHPELTEQAWRFWDPTVLYDSTTSEYRMWCSKYNPSTGLQYLMTTTSPTAHVWNDAPTTSLDPLDAGDWGEGTITSLETPAIVQVNPNTFYLYFLGYVDANKINKIGLAISTDGGASFTMANGYNPVLIGTEAWETVNPSQAKNGVKEPSVIYEAHPQYPNIPDSGTFHMWYNSSAYGTQVGYATSKGGKVWTKSSLNPIFSGHTTAVNWEVAYEVNHVNVVKNPNGGYSMFYANKWEIGSAWSEFPDSNFVRDPLPTPMISASYDSAYQPCPTCQWEFVNLEGYGGPSVLYQNDSIYLFHMRTLEGAHKWGKGPLGMNGVYGMNFGLATGYCPVIDTTSNLSVSTTGFDGFTLYPNPSDGIVYLTSEHSMNTPRILSASGREMTIPMDLFSSEIRLDFQNVGSGVYWVLIETSSGILRRRVIIL